MTNPANGFACACVGPVNDGDPRCMCARLADDLGRPWNQWKDYPMRAMLVTLIRIGFLVTVNGERATADTVLEPELRELLMTILQAKDTAAAVTALSGESS